ncbi:MAG: C25 family cysteine peptidase, partial [Bacteroidia bacterium]
MKLILSFIFSTIFIIHSSLYAQNTSSTKLKWRVIEEFYPNLQIDRKLLSFENAEYNPNTGQLPTFIKRIESKNGLKPIVKLQILKTRTVNNDANTLKYFEFIENEFKTLTSKAYANGAPVYFYSLTPLRKNGNQIELIDDFNLEITWIADDNTNGNLARKRSNKIDSKLRSGTWHKISVTQNGIYKLDKSFFDKNDIDISGTDVNKIAVFGYGGRELPMLNSADRPEDIAQIPSKSFGLTDGSFDNGDYIIFYAQGPLTWQLNNKGTFYKHEKHAYADDIQYFVGIGEHSREEPTSLPELSGNSDVLIDEYDYLYVHHIDQLTDISKNVKTGKEWFGEEFNFNTKQEFDLGTIDGFKSSDSFMIKSSVYARNVSSGSSFNVLLNGKNVLTQFCSRAGSDYLDTYAHSNTSTIKAKSSSNALKLTYEYNKPNSSAVGWLNFFEIQAKAKLIYNGQQLSFRNKDIITSTESLAEIRIQSTANNFLIWNVSQINDVKSVPFNVNNGTVSFKTYAENVDEYIIFNPSNALNPNYVDEVKNQNLHGMPFADVLIVAYDSFVDEAQELAAFHAARENFRVNIATPQQIYNEFSSGTQDITAIRDFIRYFYENANTDTDKPRYLIMFGDASYDFKDRILDNTNLVPSYQSKNS